jgi:hypothetical protein
VAALPSVAQKKAAMEKAMVEATYMVEEAAKAKREAELKAQEEAEVMIITCQLSLGSLNLVHIS